MSHLIPTQFPSDRIWDICPMRSDAIFAGLVNGVRGVLPSHLDPGIPLDVGSDGVAVIEVVGPLTRDMSLMQAIYGGTSYQRIGEAVRQAMGREDVVGIVFLMDTPGGSVDGLPELGDYLFSVRGVKPMVTQVSGLCASAGYYVASAAGPIFAGRMDEVGSIGTRAMVFDFTEMLKDAGIAAYSIDTGEFKAAGSPYVKFTESHRGYFQGLVDAHFADFQSVVSRGRGLKGKRLSGVSDGRVFMAKDALGLGLIDGIQGLDVTRERLLKGSLTVALSAGRGDVVDLADEMDGVDVMDGNEAVVEGGTAPVVGATPVAVEQAVVPGVAQVTHHGTVGASVCGASYAALKNALVGADADFICAQLERNATLDQARDAWMAEQNRRLEAAQSAVPAGAVKKPGVPVLGDGGGGPAAAGSDWDDPVVAWRTKLQEKTASGMSRGKAVSAVVRENPGLREAMVVAHNEAHGRVAKVY